MTQALPADPFADWEPARNWLAPGRPLNVQQPENNISAPIRKTMYLVNDELLLGIVRWHEYPVRNRGYIFHPNTSARKPGRVGHSDPFKAIPKWAWKESTILLTKDEWEQRRTAKETKSCSFCGGSGRDPDNPDNVCPDCTGKGYA